MKWRCLLFVVVVALSGCTEREQAGPDARADGPGVEGEWLLSSAGARLAEAALPGSAFTVSGHVAAKENDTRVVASDASPSPGPGWAVKWTVQVDVDGVVHICRVEVSGTGCDEAGYPTPEGQTPFFALETDSDSAFSRFTEDERFTDASDDPGDRLVLSYSDERWTLTVTDRTTASGGQWTWDIASGKVAGETW